MSLKHPKIIVVALDTSSRAAGVLEEGIDLAQKLGGKLLLVRSVGIPHEIPAEALGATPNDVPEILARVAREELAQRAAAVPAEYLHGVEVRTGVAWQVICDEAKAVSADLIVIGSHGYHGIDKLLGTTASRVVNHADRSVLVVRERAAKKG